MDQKYELHTHEVEDVHWWYAGRRRVLRQVVAGMDLDPGSSILDAGCGSGRNMTELSKFGRVTGIELADASVSVARARGVGEVVQGSVDALPFDYAVFDLAVSLDVIEHLEDDRRALREMRRVVVPGGRLLVTVPAYQWLWSSHDVVNHHHRRYRRATLLTAAQEAGWQLVSSTHFNSLLLPAAIVTRGLERLRPRAPREGFSDLDRTPRLLNSVLQRPFNLEARVIGSGRRIPAGLSLLAIFA